MDCDKFYHSSSSSLPKKRNSFDVSSLEDSSLLLAQNRKGQEISGTTEIANSAPTLARSYPFTNEARIQTMARSDPITATHRYRHNNQSQNNNNNDDEINNYHPAEYSPPPDFVLFRHPQSPLFSSAGHSPSSFLMSPSSSLTLDNLFPDLSSLL
ncbi:hypothetical protein BCR42DRAFT_408741 [Absidia repens]|uniref:Uncharacterized protein n=1 Tax=Absidia repens TaxID=90262 RepID=A0A1X2IQ87_9FUNG|nr:hypothetical protein BCR42DRAFT_408741 [Absidia repens]